MIESAQRNKIHKIMDKKCSEVERYTLNVAMKKKYETTEFLHIALLHLIYGVMKRTIFCSIQHDTNEK